MFLIKEKTHEINHEDVLKICTIAEEEFFKVFPKWKNVNPKNIELIDFDKEIVVKTLSTKQLKKLVSGDILKYIDSNLTVKFGFFYQNSYIPSKHEIKVGINIFLCNDIKNKYDGNTNLNFVAKKLNIKKIESEISRSRLFDALVHELTHWLDDVKNNNSLFSKEKEALNKIKPMSWVYNVKDIDSSYIEFNAQIHVIKSLKQIYYKKWDSINILEMLSLDHSLKHLYRKFRREKGVSYIKNWLLKLIKRMEREKILGRKMNYIPKTDDSIMLEGWELKCDWASTYQNYYLDENTDRYFINKNNINYKHIGE